VGAPFLPVFTLLNSANSEIRFQCDYSFIDVPVLPAAFLSAFVSFYRNWTIEFLKASIEAFEGISSAYLAGKGKLFVITEAFL